MRIALLALLVFTCCEPLEAQTISGNIRAPSGEPVQGATIMLKQSDSSRVLHYAVSDARGMFHIAWGGLSHCIITVRHISFDPSSLLVDTISSGIVQVVLNARSKDLKEVVVRTQMPVVVRNDTVIYNAGAYAAPDVRKVEELLGRMQGFGISPDGKITYNGRPVEKVLVDGEDLAGKGYQLLTRNLGAGYVDKVEVITNFSPNRLVGELGRQDAVGVNLRIKQQYKGKISASAEAAYGSRRYHGNGTLLSLRKAYKSFAFADANNTAGDVMGSLGNISEGDGFPDGSMSGTIETGKMVQPSVSERYRKNNRDAAAALMLSWRSGRRNRMRALLGYLYKGLENLGNADISTVINDATQWRVKNEIREMSSLGSPFVKVMGQRDDSLGKIDDYFVDLRYERPEGEYSNIASVDVNDSLMEKLHSKRIYVGVGWKATRARPGRKLLQVNTEGYYLNSREAFNSSTGRYAVFFGLPGTYDQSRQYNGLERFRITGTAAWLSRERSGKWHYGISAFMDRSLLATATNFAGLVNDTGYTSKARVGSAGANLDLRKTINAGKNTDILLVAKAGPRMARAVEASSFFPGFDLSVEYVKRFTTLRVIRTRFAASNDIPDLLKETPAPVLSGNATILGGIDLTGSVLTASYQASYFSNNIRRQSNWSFSLFLSASPSYYAASVLVEPEYSASVYRREIGGYSAMLLAGYEKYVGAVRGKLGFSVTGSAAANRFSLNGASVLGRNMGAQGEAWWISGFRSGLSLETRGRLGWHCSSVEGQPGSSVVRAGFSQKLHWRSSKRFFATAILNGVQLGTGQWFHGLDLFMQKHLGDRFMVYVKGVNLLNIGKITEKWVYPYSRSTNEFMLVRRYILLGLSFGLK